MLAIWHLSSAWHMTWDESKGCVFEEHDIVLAPLLQYEQFVFR